MRIRNKAYFLVFALLLGSLFTYDGPDKSEAEVQAGDLISSEIIQTYSEMEMAGIIQSMGVSESITVLQPIRAVKLIYYSTDISGNLINLSGALIFPENTSNIRFLVCIMERLLAARRWHLPIPLTRQQDVLAS